MKLRSKFCLLAAIAIGIGFYSLVNLNATRAQSKSSVVASPATTFTNSTAITIPAMGNASPYPSTIAVSGLSGTATQVTVTLNNFGHSFPDDLGVVLVGPTGAALLLMDGCGESPVSNVTFTLADSGATALPDVDPWTAGTYKPAAYFTGDPFPAPGPGTTYNHPGPAGGNTATLASTFNGTAPNGNWNLYIVDFVAGDSGGVTGGWTLNITTNGGPTITQHVVDFNGDGKTDFAVSRASTPTQIDWFSYDGIGAYPAGYTSTTLGSPATDYITPEDFDGDNKTDIAVWREDLAGSAGFYILQSTTSTVRFDNFGQTGDDPSVVGDYDGDGSADPAVYRCPGIADPSAQCYFFYRGSLTPSAITYVPWGFGNDGDFFPNVGDFTGDGKNDFCIQRSIGGGQGQFVLLRNGDFGVEYVTFGLDSDFVIPGDYDGDGKADFCVRRTVSGARIYYVLTRTGAFSATRWGITGDISVPGDYDGDGKTDFAVWRGNVDPDQNYFYVLNSSNSSVRTLEFGQCPTGNCDYAVAGYSVH